MSLALGSTQSLTLTLAAAPAITQPTYVVAFRDNNDTAGTVTEASGPSHGSATGTTPKTILSAPTSGVSRSVTYASIYNADSASVTATVSLADTAGGGSTRTLKKVALAAGEELQYTPARGWVLPESAAIPVSITGGTTQPGYVEKTETIAAGDFMEIDVSGMSGFSAIGSKVASITGRMDAGDDTALWVYERNNLHVPAYGITLENVAFHGTCAGYKTLRIQNASLDPGTYTVRAVSGPPDMHQVIVRNIEPVPVSFSATPNVIATCIVPDGQDSAQGGKADTAATTDTGTFSLVALTKRLLTKIPALGQAVKASSLPVTIASNQDTLVVSNATLESNVGATNETAASSDSATSGLNGLIRRLLGRFIAPFAAGDSVANPTTTGVVAFDSLYDQLAGTWFRRPGYNRITTHASASRGAGTVNGSVVDARGFKRAIIRLNVTVNPSSAATFTVAVNDSSGNFRDVTASTAVSAVQGYCYGLGPGLILPAGTTYYQQVWCVPLPQKFMVLLTQTNTGTASVEVELCP